MSIKNSPKQLLGELCNHAEWPLGVLLMFADTLFRLLGPFISFLSLFVNVYNCYLILRKSPSSISVYRYFMLYFTCYDTLFTAVLLLFQPEPMMPVLGAVVHGSIRFLPIPGVGHYAMTLCVFLGAQMICALNWSVLYRFLVIWKHGEYLPTMLRPAWIIFALVLGWSISLALASVMPLNALDCESLIRSTTEEGVYDTLRERLEVSEMVFGYYLIPGGSATFSAVIATLGILFSYGLNVSTAVYITRTLKRMRTRMSVSTFRMHRQLAALLFVQGIYPMTIMFPIICIVASYPLGLTNAILRDKTFISIGVFAYECYPLLNGLATIVFVAAFRQHVFDVLTGFFAFSSCFNKRQVTSFQRPASITQNEVPMFSQTVFIQYFHAAVL